MNVQECEALKYLRNIIRICTILFTQSFHTLLRFFFARHLNSITTKNEHHHHPRCCQLFAINSKKKNKRNNEVRWKKEREVKILQRIIKKLFNERIFESFKHLIRQIAFVFLLCKILSLLCLVFFSCPVKILLKIHRKKLNFQLGFFLKCCARYLSHPPLYSNFFTYVQIHIFTVHSTFNYEQ